MTETFTSSSQIGLVSFDLWLTLIKSNPKYKPERNAYLRDMVAPFMSFESFDEIIRAEDKRADKIAETGTGDLGFKERVAMMANAVGAETPPDDILEDMYGRQGEIFAVYPPVLIDPNTLELFTRLHEKYDLAALSNTGMMHGDQMRVALGQIGIGNFFDYQVFSNEVGYAKPDTRIFNKLLEEAVIEPSEVLHIGDNYHADFNGARAVGMHAIHLMDPITLESVSQRLIR